MSTRQHDQRNTQLVTLQEKSLVERLALANRRITDLEKRERTLILERDKLAILTKMEVEGAILGREETALWPAAGLERLIESLTIVQRRDAWLSTLVKLGIRGSAAGLFPHGGKSGDPLTVLLRGSGGFGDMLYLSLIARLLFLHFDRARVVILHEHPDADRVFASNPFVMASISLQGDAHQELLRVAAALDIFDLIADVRYVISYATPPYSRIPAEFLTVAHSRAAPWQRYVRREWPYLNNLLAREASARNMSKYELLGYTGNLPATSADAGDFFPTDPLPVEIEELRQPYVTLHHGADRFMSNHDGLSTKNLPESTWSDIVGRCKVTGIKTIQVGEDREPLIEGVTIDLRGKTSFSQTASVLKYAAAHLDTEGGLVHLARAMGTTSVVAFGPTPPKFFAYEGNINLKPEQCGDCWWISQDWARRCPRGMSKPVCMSSHLASRMAEAAIGLASRRKAVKISGSWLDLASIYTELGNAAKQAASSVEGASTSGLVVVDRRDDLSVQLRTLAQQKLAFQLAVPTSLFADIVETTTFLDILPFTPGHIPARTESYDWALVCLKEIGAVSRVQTIHEVVRILKPGAIACLLTGSESLVGEVKNLQRQLRALPGARFVVRTGSVASRIGEDSMLLPCLFLSIQQRGETEKAPP